MQAAIDAGTPYDLELPLITGAGRHLWVRTQGYAEWQDGKVVRIYGTFQDITAQRLAAEELREREAELVTRNAALRRFNKVAVGRELRMIELKQEVNALCARLAEPPRYGAGALATPQPPVEP